MIDLRTSRFGGMDFETAIEVATRVAHTTGVRQRVEQCQEDWCDFEETHYVYGAVDFRAAM